MNETTLLNERAAAWRGGRHALLWAFLSLVTAAILTVPRLPVAAPNPLLAVSVSTLVAGVGLALLLLGLLRFRIFGRPVDLFAGLAFGSLAIPNLVTGVLAPIARTEMGPPEAELYLALLRRGLAAGLFLLGLWGAQRPVSPARRRAWVAAWGLGGAALLALTSVLVLRAGARLPDPVSQGTLQLLGRGTAVVSVLPGQHPLLVITDLLLAALLLTAALGYLGLARRLADPHVESLAVGLTLLFFAHLQAVLFPPLAVDYASTADAFRLAAYVFFLFSLVIRMAGELTERAAREERLRLSRELHDGLAQQLSLLQLRLSRAGASGRSGEDRVRDLQVALRLAEAATLEARQAIMALRDGVMSGEAFLAGIAGFCEEFGQNHEVEIDVEAEGDLGPIGADVHAELLRLLHEACSNAIRHGRASGITVRLARSNGWLDVTIRDDGQGFEEGLASAQPGIGLRSMRERTERRGGAFALQSTPGRGTTLQLRFPIRSLPAQRG